ncbi:MAG: apolipoprotein N-acyltransferase [Rhodobacteraceae bacterium]|nr:apolipoprotein N-acyltransferase [Paracoccaceae bacterium]
MMRAPRWRATVQMGLGYGALGVVMAAGQAPLGWWWATLAALTALFLILPMQAPPRVWAGRLWAAGAGYFAASLFWIIEPFFVEPEIHGWMAPFALMLMAGGLALFWAGAGWIAARLIPGPADRFEGALWHVTRKRPRAVPTHPPRTRPRALPALARGRDQRVGEPQQSAGWDITHSARRRIAALVLAMTGLELLRGWVFTGFPWASLGHVLIDTGAVHLAALGGAGLLSLLVLGGAALLAHGARARRLPALVLAVALGAGAWGWGHTRPPAPDPLEQIIRLAQPNAPQDEKWRDDRALFFFERLLDQTSAPAQPAPALILWPETSVPFFLEFPGEGLVMMAEAIAVHGADARLGFGVQRYEDRRYFNSLALIDRDAQVSHIYDKHHLVPFGEYVPFSEAILGTGLAGFAAQVLAGYSPGPGPALLDLGDLGTALPLICYESIFPRHLRTTARPDWVLQITNDAWFGTLTGPYQHLAQARLRAVEQGLPVLRAANTGVSAVIDARGGVSAQLGLGQAGYLDAPLPRALPPTPYARLGDWPIWLIVLGGLALLALRSRGQQG